jgi:hypothetical protein
MTDDDSLAAYDLSAWHAPPPPAGLADAVVRRMTQPNLPARRVWVVAASAVAAAAAVLIALLVFDRREPAVDRAAASEHDETRREMDRLLAELARLDAELTALQVKLPMFDHAATAPTKTVPAPRSQQTAPRSMGADIAAVQEVMRRSRPALLACNDGSFAGTLTIDLHIEKTGKLATLVYSRRVAFERCLETILGAAKFDVRSGTPLVLSFPLAFPRPAKPTVCDAMKLRSQGIDSFQGGMFGEALVRFERALACKWDQRIIPMAMLAACHSKNLAKARQYYPQLSEAQKSPIVMRCLDNNIDPR